MAKLLLYCTKAKKQKDLLWSNNLKHFFLDGAYNRLIDDLPEYLLNGKIVAECDFEVEEIKYFKKYDRYGSRRMNDLFLSKYSCLSRGEIKKYLKEQNGYAIHIKNLHIFDEPKELSDYKIIRDNGYSRLTLTKSPQNMMKVKEFKNGMVTDYILISIKPQWLCKILNDEKIIEVRKKVLKEMLNNGRI